MTNTPTTFFGWIIFLIQQYHGYYLQGLLTTLETSSQVRSVDAF